MSDRKQRSAEMNPVPVEAVRNIRSAAESKRNDDLWNDY
jgi:hypothetical protein